jgi:diacylglycerol kinase (ATP)
MSRKMRFSFIINPEAGRGKSKKLDSVLHSLLKSRNIDFSIEKTKGARDAIGIARESASEFDVVVAVGGDGTANEVRQRGHRIKGLHGCDPDWVWK